MQKIGNKHHYKLCEPNTLRGRSRRGQRRDPQYGAPLVPRVPMSHDRGHYHGTVSDGFYDSERPKTPNRK